MAIFDINWFSTSLRRQLPLIAIVPTEPPRFPGAPGFDPASPLRTLILLHGFSANHREWLINSRIEMLAMLHGVAVLCPSGENSFYLDDPNRDAYYERLLSEELLGFARRTFPLSHKREDTMVGGLSMGGYGALHTGLRHPDVFGGIIALSSALITDTLAQTVRRSDNPIASAEYYRHVFGDVEKVVGSDKDPKALATALCAGDTPRPRLYMACGTEDFLIEPNRSLHSHLASIGYDHAYIEAPGAHTWAFWDAYIEKALDWMDAAQ